MPARASSVAAPRRGRIPAANEGAGTRRPAPLHAYVVDRASQPFPLVLAAVTAFGVLLRLPSFNSSLFGDELSTYFIASSRSLGHVVHLLQDHSIDLNPPLSFVLAWLAHRVDGSPQSMRFFSLLAGTATIPLTYVVGVRLVGRVAALVGATLVALSPFLIFYSTEARPYALLMLLVLLSTLALLRALDTGRSLWWIAFAAASCAAVYTHYVAVFPLAGEVVWAFWAGPYARRALSLSLIGAVAGFVPWMPTFLKETHSPGASAPDILTPFTLHTVRTDIGRVAVGHPFIRLTTIPGRPALVLIAAGLAAGLGGVVLRRRALIRSRDELTLSRETVLVLVLAFAVPLGIALYSWVAPHSIWDKNKLISSVPALGLAVGALVTSGRRFVSLAATGLVIGGVAIGGIEMLQAKNQRPNYGAAARFIDRTATVRHAVLDWPAPTPGPLTALDVAFAGSGSDQTAFRMGFPPIQAILSKPPYTPVVAPPPRLAAAMAEAKADGGELFVVAFGSRPALTLVMAAADIPRRLHVRETRTFPGFLPVSVAVLRQR